MFIGRDNELKSLNKIKGRGKAALVVMRGRRRIGKSRLISEFARGFPTYFEFQGLGSRAGMNNQIQLDHFARQLSQRLNIPPLKLSDWREAFSFLARETQTGPVLIMLDEIAWMGNTILTMLVS
jgi:AAA+ ATPase superfamily predicted ATPase